MENKSATELTKEQSSLLKSKEGDLWRAAAQWIKDADFVLLCGGAGMSIGTGLNYSDPNDFAQKYPAMLQYGYKTGYQCMGLPREQPVELAWGYWAAHVNNMRFKGEPHIGYKHLLSMVEKKNYFVLTSNVDCCFMRSGFDKTRIYTPQGDFGLVQCFKPCNRKVFDAWPVVSNVLPQIDPKTQKIPSSAVPRCTQCGTQLFGNVRGGAFYIHDHFHAANLKLQQWIKDTKGKGKLVVLEIGSGFNTPTVTRFPMESVSRWHDNAAFIRVNLDHFEVPLDLPRAVGLASEGRPALALLKHLVETQSSADGALAIKAVTIQRGTARVAAEKAGVVEQWQLIQQRWGHFDWQQFMTSLARNDEDEEQEEEEAEEGHSHEGGDANEEVEGAVVEKGQPVSSSDGSGKVSTASDSSGSKTAASSQPAAKSAAPKK